MSNNIVTTPAAKLVGEYEELAYKYQNWDGDSIPEPTQRDSDRVDEIAQELERRCDAAGISIVDGSFVYEKEFKGRIMNLISSGPFKHYTKIPASEQHALEGWLLMKDGK